MTTPTYALSVWIRIFIKALVLLFVFNVLFGVLHLAKAITSLSVYGTLVP